MVGGITLCNCANQGDTNNMGGWLAESTYVAEEIGCAAMCCTGKDSLFYIYGQKHRCNEYEFTVIDQGHVVRTR